MASWIYFKYFTSKAVALVMSSECMLMEDATPPFWYVMAINTAR